jgi:multimeric flavodoxin WrbA
MPSLLLVYYSITGGTHQMIDACAAAARSEPGIDVIVKRAQEARADDVLNANAYVFASPEYLGAMSGMLKDFFDRTYYDALGKIEGFPYAIMVCAGSDGIGAAKQIERIATGWRLKSVAAPVIVNVAAQTPSRILAPKTMTASQLRPCAELGSLLAGGLSIGLF